jgi:hypothetical protein
MEKGIIEIRLDLSALASYVPHLTHLMIANGRRVNSGPGLTGTYIYNGTFTSFTLLCKAF